MSGLTLRWRFAFWFVNYFSFGKAAPYVLGAIVGRWPHKVPDEATP